MLIVSFKSPGTKNSRSNCSKQNGNDFFPSIKRLFVADHGSLHFNCVNNKMIGCKQPLFKAKLAVSGPNCAIWPVPLQNLSDDKLCKYPQNQTVWT